MQFTPLEEFYSQELRSTYLVGLSYTARDENHVLLSLIPKWIQEKKIRLGAPNTPIGTAKIKGVGRVT